MSNIHRIIWFDQEIRRNRYPNCRRMAQEFEISVRQALRDIDYMRNSLRAPLIYVAVKRGFCYEDESFVLPNIYITDEEKKILSFLAYRYENFDNTPKTARIANLFKNLTASHLHDNNVPVFEINKHIIDGINNIQTAIIHKQKLKVIYKDPQKGALELAIHPYKLFRRYSVDYIVSFCEEYDKETVLRLDRTLSIKILKEHFTEDMNIDMDKYSSEYRIKPFTARVEFCRNPDKLFGEFTDIRHVSGYIYDICFFDTNRFIAQLFACDYLLKIHYPKWLSEKLRKRCKSILDSISMGGL